METELKYRLIEHSIDRDFLPSFRGGVRDERILDNALDFITLQRLRRNNKRDRKYEIGYEEILLFPFNFPFYKEPEAVFSYELGNTVVSRDPWTIRALAMMAEIEDKKVSFAYPEMACKYWPQFWDFLEAVRV